MLVLLVRRAKYQIPVSIVFLLTALMGTTASAQPVQIDSVTFTNPACGASDGEIIIHSSLGFGFVEYSADSAVTFQSSNTFSSLTSGVYYLFAQDSAGFIDTVTLILAGEGTLINSLDGTDPLCAGGNDGSIDVITTGGTVPFIYSIDSGMTYQALNSFTGLTGGAYQIIVLDSNFCTDTGSVTITDPPALSFTTNLTDETCPLADGQIEIISSGGTGTVQHSINGGTTFQAGNTFPGLTSGPYDMVIEDNNGCRDSGSVVLNSSVGPTIITLNHINPLCNGSNNGSITILAVGAPPITYSLDGSAFTGTSAYTGLAPGSYTVVAQDDNGCQAGVVVTITEPDVLQSQVDFFDETCIGNDGEIHFTTTGAVQPYTYSIDGGSTTGSSPDFTGLNGGTYDYIIEDANGCQETGQLVLETGVGPTVQAINLTNQTCPGTTDGGIEIIAVAQTGPIQYSINGGATVFPNGDFSGLPEGNYDIYLEDGNGCITTQTITLTGPATPFADFTPDVTEGFIPQDVNFTNTSVGATGYEWSFGEPGATSTATDPSYTYTTAGTYTIQLVATDGICSDTATVQIIIEGEPSLTIPNVFTPNGDGFNDFFYVESAGMVSMHGEIFNRSGQLINVWDGINGGWDGRTMPAGVEAPEGTYWYRVTATDINGEAYEESGFFTMFRTINRRQRN